MGSPNFQKRFNFILIASKHIRLHYLLVEFHQICCRILYAFVYLYQGNTYTWLRFYRSLLEISPEKRGDTRCQNQNTSKNSIPTTYKLYNETVIYIIIANYNSIFCSYQCCMRFKIPFKFKITIRFEGIIDNKTAVQVCLKMKQSLISHPTTCIKATIGHHTDFNNEETNKTVQLDITGPGTTTQKCSDKKQLCMRYALIWHETAVQQYYIRITCIQMCKGS